MSKITTIPIKELCRLDTIRKEYGMQDVDFETFCIPNYQRGYRWDAEIHVKALLNDIRDFMNMSNARDDRYCLQPIVVTQSTTYSGAWEVIDGQQRLTTLFLILKALKKPCFNIAFETRDISTTFIRDLVENKAEDHSNPDFHFMSAAWKKINTWLDEENKKSPEFIDEFRIILLKNIHVIWFDIESDDRNANIDVFNRLNIGKIPLTDAELVKALLLSKIKGLYKDSHELTIRQAEISDEWQRMEIELRKPQKWGFLTGNMDKDYNSHIELLFDLLASNMSTSHQGVYTTFLWFEKHISEAGRDPLMQGEKANELWRRIKVAFARINTWFCDSTPDSKATVYHYVGYLLSSGKANIHTLYNLADSKSKKDFEQALKSLIVGTIKDIDLEQLSYLDNNEEIKRILLLYNVLTCEKIADGIYNRFPFDRYNEIAAENRGRGGWSLEHIFAQNSQDAIKDKRVAHRWLADTKESIEKIEGVTKPSKSESVETSEWIDISDLKTAVDEMLLLPESDINMDDFNKLRQRLNDVFGEPDKHPLSNMALLSTRDNASLNNAIFPTKRDRIIELEKAGRFIPPCTRNVFLKFYSAADCQPYYWGESDQQSYLQDLISVINEFKGKK